MEYSQKEAEKKLRTKYLILRIWPKKRFETHTTIQWMWRQLNGCKAVPANLDRLTG